MPNRKRSKIECSLAKKGFVKKETHHIIYYFMYNNKVRSDIKTRVSRGKGHKDYGDKLLSEMKKQLKLDNINQLLELIDCRLDEEGYIKILEKKGEL